MAGIDDAEHRRHVRFRCAGRAEIYLTPDGTPQAAGVFDLSLEGTLLVFDKEQSTRRGAILELAFNVNNLQFRVRGEVMVVRSLTTVGVQFAQLSTRVQNQLADLIEELTEAHLKQEANKAKTEKLRQAKLVGLPIADFLPE